MVDFQSMQKDYAQQLAKLRGRYGIKTVPANGKPAGLSDADAYNYAREEDAIYGAEYDRRINALLIDYRNKFHEDPDRDMKLVLTDQARQSFGAGSLFSEPIPESSTLSSLPEATWDVMTDALSLANPAPLYAVGTGVLSSAVAPGTAGESALQALPWLLAAIIVYAVVRYV